MGEKASTPSTTGIFSGPGNRINVSISRLSKDLIDKISEYETPDISDQLNRLYAMRADMQNIVNDVRICGTACTVKVYPGDNLMVHKSLDVAKPGDVVVIDASGCSTAAVLGDLVAQKAKHRGIQGFIIDGFARDLPMLKKVGLPVFARGITPVGPLHRGPGEINFPICCGGVVVNPGDIVVADQTGVVVLPKDFAKETLDHLEEKKDRLEEYCAAVARGEFSNAWIDPVLKDLGTKLFD
jgi:RraA family protein